MKWAEHPRPDDAAAFGNVEKALASGRVARKTIICRAPNPYPVTPDARAVPVTMLDEVIS